MFLRLPAMPGVASQRTSQSSGAAVAVLMLLCSSVFATVPGINSYQQGKFEDAYKEFQDTLKSHPQSQRRRRAPVRFRHRGLQTEGLQ
jgi:hypothetical protein